MRRLAAATTLIALICALALTGPLSQPSHAADFTAGDSASWETAVASAAANTGEITTITITNDFTYDLADTPAYAGDAYELLVDGGGHTITASGSNTSSWLSASGGSGKITVRDLTLAGFSADSAASLETTGNISLADLTVRDFNGLPSALVLDATYIHVMSSSFARNTAGSTNGGAVHATCDYLELRGTSFTDNATGGHGGAVYSDGCEVTLALTHFTDNTAGDDGGAVYGGTYVSASQSTFTGNQADGSGGAVTAVTGGKADRSTFTSNQAGVDGGAFSVADGSIQIEGSTFTDNSASLEGGAARGDDHAYVEGSTFRGNTASLGGAVFSYGDSHDPSTFAQSTFVDNAASVTGGGVYSRFDDVEVSHTTMTGNSATGGAHVWAHNSGVEAYGSVFDDAVDGDGCVGFTAVVSADHNFDADGTCTGSWNQAGDIGDDGEEALLGALADNGGPTQTRHPLPDSPLINAIPWAYCDAHATDPRDQRGVTRAEAGADTEGCDIGAVEVAQIEFTVATDNGDVDVSVLNALEETCADWTSITGYTPTPPADVSFPFGVFDYCFELPGDGWTVTIELDLPSPVTELWKVTDNTWSEVTGATIAGTTITYDITDGDALDEDGSANGEIIDPVAPGISATFTGSSRMRV